MTTYDDLITLFKQRKFKDVISSASAMIANLPIQGDAAKIRIADLALRSCLMIDDDSQLAFLLRSVGPVPSLSHFHAAKEFAEGNISKGWAYLSNCSAFSASTHGWWSVGLNSIARSPDWDMIPVPPSTLSFEEFGSIDGSGHAFIMSADDLYFQRFFDVSINSISANSPSQVVYHVINPSKEAEDIIKARARAGLMFLVERTAQKPEKSYYACGRFFAAQYVLARVNAALFVVDVDAYVADDFNKILTSPHWSPDCVIGKIAKEGRPILPWQRISAGSTYIPANDVGRTYLYWVCRFIEHVRSRSAGENLWWIDQNALFFAYLKSDRSRFKDWDERVRKNFISFPGMFADKDKALAKMASNK